jgi:hypothetical protein
MYALINTVPLFPFLFVDIGLRTSAAAAAAAFGSLAAFPSPNVRGGPPTVRFGVDPVPAFAVDGTEAFVAGAGAEPRVRPGPSKPSLDCLPQRLPMGVVGVESGSGMDVERGERVGEWRGGGMRRSASW